MEFVHALADDLAADFTVDPARLFVTGFANGGFMARRPAREASDRFAAFAFVCLRRPSSAPPFPEYVVPCAQASPAPVLLMHGTQDVGIPWDGIRARVVGRERIATFFAPETWLGSLAVGEVQRRKHSIVVYGQRVFLPCLRRGANQDDVMLASNMTSA